MAWWDNDPLASGSTAVATPPAPVGNWWSNDPMAGEPDVPALSETYTPKPPVDITGGQYVLSAPPADFDPTPDATQKSFADLDKLTLEQQRDFLINDHVKNPIPESPESIIRIKDLYSKRIAARDAAIEQIPVMIPQEQLDTSLTEIQALPDGPEKTQLLAEHATSQATRSQVEHDVNEGASKGLTYYQQRETQLPAQQGMAALPDAGRGFLMSLVGTGTTVHNILDRAIGGGDRANARNNAIAEQRALNQNYAGGELGNLVQNTAETLTTLGTLQGLGIPVIPAFSAQIADTTYSADIKAGHSESKAAFHAAGTAALQAAMMVAAGNIGKELGLVPREELLTPAMAAATQKLFTKSGLAEAAKNILFQAGEGGAIHIAQSTFDAKTGVRPDALNPETLFPEAGKAALEWGVLGTVGTISEHAMRQVRRSYGKALAELPKALAEAKLQEPAGDARPEQPATSEALPPNAVEPIPEPPRIAPEEPARSDQNRPEAPAETGFTSLSDKWQRLPPGTPVPNHPSLEVRDEGPNGVLVRRAQPEQSIEATPFADKPLDQMNRGELLEAANALGIENPSKQNNNRLRERISKAIEERPIEATQEVPPREPIQAEAATTPEPSQAPLSVEPATAEAITGALEPTAEVAPEISATQQPAESMPTAEPAAAPSVRQERPTINAGEYERRLREAASTPAEADALLSLANANAQYRGETLDEWAAKNIADVELADQRESRYLKHYPDAPAEGTPGQQGKGVRVVRGEVQFLQDGRAIIRAFKETRNVATLTHETGHVFRRTLLPEELSKTEKALGVENGKWNRASEERFARMFERYLRDGKAPTKSLKSVFAKFKEWLTTVYSNLSKTALAEEIQPELREVFDKMLGAREAKPIEAKPVEPELPAWVTEDDGFPGYETPPERPPLKASDRAKIDRSDSIEGQQGLFEGGDETLFSSTPGYAYAKREPTSTKNAVEDRERADLGLPSAKQSAPESFDQWDQAAKATLARNPEAGRELVAEVTEKPRALSEREDAVVRNYKNGVLNEQAAVAREFLDAVEAGESEAAAELQSRADRLSDELLGIMDADKASGTKAGRALVARKAMTNVDGTLGELEAVKRTAVGGRRLTPEEHVELTKLHAKIADLQQKLRDAQTKAGNEASVDAFKKLSTRAKLGRKGTFTPDDVKVNSDSTPVQLSNAARELAKFFIGIGVTEREAVIDAVHGELQKGLPNLSRRQTMDAISLYGQFSELNKNPILMRLREIAGESQQVAKLLDLEANVPLLKTGQERRAISDGERQLIKLVNEAKKKYGVETTDPARQLASALSAVKTRLRNQITDLNSQIKSGEKLIKTKSDIKYDAEAAELVKQRDAAKTEFDAMFGKPELTDAKRLELATKAAERGAAEYERRIKEGDFSDNRRAPLVGPELDAAKAKRDAMRAHYEELKALDPQSQINAERRSTLALQRKLQDRAVRYSERLAAKDFAPRKAEKKLGPMEKETAEFQAALDAIQEKFNIELLNDRMERRLKSDIANFKEQTATGIYPDVTPRQQRELTPEVRRLNVQRDLLKKQRDIQMQQDERSTVRKLWDTTGVIRLIQTTGEMSFIGRQGGKQLAASVGGLALGDTQPAKAFGRAVGKSMQSLVSERSAKVHDEAIFNSPRLGVWHDAKLRVIHEGEHISGAEEIKIRSWVDDLPVIKQVNRAGRIFLNELRTSTFDALTLNDTQAGTLTPERAAIIGGGVNTFTGYTSLGPLESSAPILNEVLYSARNLAASMKFLVGQPLWRGDAHTRKIFAQQYARTFIGMAAFYALAKLAGAEVEDDPRSSDFGKIRFGNTRIDPLMGLSQLTVFAAREFTGELKSTDGKVTAIRQTLRPLNLIRDKPLASKVPYGAAGGYKLAGDFLRSKLSPNISLIADLIDGKDLTGNETSFSGEAGKSTPITYGDIYRAMKEQGVPKGAALGMLAFFGAGLQTYQPKKPKPFVKPLKSRSSR